MKILFSSFVFSPSVGGIETVSELLAPEFVKAGHEVIMVTKTLEEDGIARSYPLHRRPSPGKLLELVRWCDVYFQSSISLRFAWPLLLVRRPWIIVHPTWILSPDQQGWNPKVSFKLFLLRFATNVTISHAIAGGISVRSVIIGNPYSDVIFRQRPEISRDRELAYLGRLVTDKGVDLLVQALARLKDMGLRPRLTIIGTGEEKDRLCQLAHDLGVRDQMEFMGSMAGEELARMLNAHQALVVPSRLPEPFGIVALEGMASGCVVVASRAGGLPDVVGPCGLTYENGDLGALTDALAMVLSQPELRESILRGVEEHLNRFRPATVAARYLEVIARASEKR